VDNTITSRVKAQVLIFPQMVENSLYEDEFACLCELEKNKMEGKSSIDIKTVPLYSRYCRKINSGKKLFDLVQKTTLT
jgi:hypothetical protein